jgi:hypothetical protein
MIEVDRAMMEDYRIELIQMMENAGRNLAHLARDRFFDGNPRGKKVVVLAELAAMAAALWSALDGCTTMGHRFRSMWANLTQILPRSRLINWTSCIG